jgi:hypothetical protein
LVGKAIYDQDGQGFFLFAFQKSTLFKGCAALLPGSKIIRLVGDYHNRISGHDINARTPVEQAGRIVDVAAVVTAAFNQGRIRFENQKLATVHFFISEKIKY